MLITRKWLTGVEMVVASRILAGSKQEAGMQQKLASCLIQMKREEAKSICESN